jgi:hypothetical protein
MLAPLRAYIVVVVDVVVDVDVVVVVVVAIVCVQQMATTAATLRPTTCPGS